MDTERITKNRFARINTDTYLKEKITFVKAGTGVVAADHPKRVTVSGEPGEWVVETISNYLGDFSGGIPDDPYSAAIQPQFTLINETQYNAGLTAQRVQSRANTQARATAASQKRTNREAVLRRLGATQQEIADFFR